MCGIAGIVAYTESARAASPRELHAMREAMAIRGPDDAGTWISPDGRAGLAHRRLAIIDLTPTGAQPMSTADGRLHITFNGEIYNYQALRGELRAKGVPLRSTSDTEVLLHLYRERGAAMVQALRGMYTFAIWDDTAKTLFLARDPFGIKPLYYADSGGTLRFASQVKALLAGGAIDGAPEPAGHVGFFVLGSVPEPYTMYRAIRALPAGHTLTLERGKPARIARFFDIRGEAIAAAATTPVPEGQRAALLRATLRDSVAHHMVADVPVGVFLSSGLDSTTLASLACEIQGSNLHSVTLGFEEYRGTHDDETPMAERTARHIGTTHETRWISRGAFEDEFENVMAAMDQPSIDGVNTYFVSKTAAGAGMKVALSGLGGDELFGGYPSFVDVPRLVRLFARARRFDRLARGVRRLTAPLLGAIISPKFASLAEYGGSVGGAYMLRRALYMPWEIEDFLDPALFKAGWEELDLIGRLEETAAGIPSDRLRIGVLEMSWYMRNQLLRDADWAGMAHSLEIRVPMVDVEVFRRLAPLLASPTPPTKVEAALTPAKRPLADVLARRKTGFSIPVHDWAKRATISRGPQRQLRNWAHIVHRPYKKLRMMAFVSDAFGGHGGIALYNRDLLTSVCRMPQCEEVVALPRVISQPVEGKPPNLAYHDEASNSKWRYVKSVARLLAGDRRYDLILCCHINLLPLAYVAKLVLRVPIAMFIYGIDAWTPRAAFKSFLLRHVERVVSISDVTREKFQRWSSVEDTRMAILPNAIHTEWYGPGPRNPRLVERYRLHGKTVLMTLGRLVSSERYKGFDEVLDVLPSLLLENPGLVYLIIGDGSDRARLEKKAGGLGVRDHVRFTGNIPEAEKPDHYRLADAFAMPSRGEGFGFVLLEAMACGVPAIASMLDGGREALRDGTLGILVDPTNLEDVKRGIREALRRGKGPPPTGLEFFRYEHFSSRAHALMHEIIGNSYLNRRIR